MTDTPSDDPPRGPILLCAGTDAAVAVRLAEAAAALLHDRSAVVLATWQPPLVLSGLDAAMDALGNVHAELRDVARRMAEQAALAAADVLDAAGMQVTRQVSLDERSPWRMILDVAEQIDAALIVGGTREAAVHPPGAIGRQARALAHRARRPLLLLAPDAVVRDADAPVLVATDGSASADRATQIASALLRPRRAVVASAWQPVGDVVGVVRVALPDDVAREATARLDEEARQHASGQAGEAAAQLAARGWSAEAVALQAPRGVAAAIVDAAEEHGAAVIVSGTRGRSRVAAVLLGSTAESVLRHAASPVLLVPAAAVEN